MRFACLLIALLLSLMTPAFALVKVTSENVNLAVKYGIKNKAFGLNGILGPNWVEGQDGTLLNIYSPFMLVATQASKTSVEETSPEAIKKARKSQNLTRIISSVTDPHEFQRVKFSVSLMGNSPTFAKEVKARVEGLGRGKTATITPIKVIYDQLADQSSGGYYEAINSYYFSFDELVNLENFQLILEGPGTSQIFHIDNREIY